MNQAPLSSKIVDYIENLDFDNMGRDEFIEALRPIIDLYTAPFLDGFFESDEMDLEILREMLRVIPRHLPMMMTLIDVGAGHRVIYVNSQGTKILGYSREQFRQMDLSQAQEFIHEYDLGGFIHHYREWSKRADEVFEHEFRMKHADGHYVWVQARYAILIRDIKGNPLYLISTLTEITRMKQLEMEEIKRAQLRVLLEQRNEVTRLRDTMVKRLQEEFRTSLATMTAITQILRNIMRSAGHDNIRNLDQMSAQIKGMGQILQEVQWVTSPLTEHDLRRELTDVMAFVRGIVAEHERQCMGVDGSGHRIYASYDDEPCEMGIDRELMGVALGHIIENALLYSERGSLVVVYVGRSRLTGTCVIEVHDQGMGIPRDEVERVWEPFHHAWNHIDGHGMGIGLTLARQIMELHGGDARLVSDMNVGTSVTLRLPLP